MRLNRLLPVLSLVLLTTFIACQKNASKNEEEAPSPELLAHNDDQNRISNELDAVNLDVNVALEKTTSFSGRIYNDTICAATIVYDTLNSTKTITITYDGKACNGFEIRNGKVIITMPSNMRWKNAGAVLNVTYQNFKVTRVRDNKSITINGTHTLTNVSGGLLGGLATGSIVHTITSDGMSITFDDGTQRLWKVARKREYSLVNGGTIKITGTHTEGNQSNISEWGTDRFGRTFTTSITQPLIFSGNCQFRLISGQVQHERAGLSATVTFGLDKDGNPVACPAGNYYYKLVWTGLRGTTQTFIAPY